MVTRANMILVYEVKKPKAIPVLCASCNDTRPHNKLNVVPEDSVDIAIAFDVISSVRTITNGT